MFIFFNFEKKNAEYKYFYYKYSLRTNRLLGKIELDFADTSQRLAVALLQTVTIQ